jgi:hypothetical protein
MFRAGWLVLHPCWEGLYNCINETDVTGCRIAAAVYRHDVRAVAESYVLLGLYAQWEPHKLLLCLFGAQMYFQWPQHEFIHAIGQCRTGILDRALLRKVGRRIFKRYADITVRDGILTSGSAGIQVTKNPSERNNGSVRYEKMISDLPGCIRICEQMALYFQARNVVSMSEMLSILGKAGSRVFDGQIKYKNIRCVRLLACAAGKVFENSVADWRILSVMSRKVSEQTEMLGLRDYAVAMKYVAALSIELNLPDYSLNDLVIFLCLRS